MQFLDIHNAFANRFSGLSVTYRGSSVDVPVIVGFPEREFFEKDYPAISILLYSLVPHYDRQDTVKEYFARDATTFDVYGKYPPDSYIMMYQIDCWARFHQHLDVVLEHVLERVHRRSYLEIGTAVLAEDVSQGDTEITLVDNSDYDFGDVVVLELNNGIIHRTQGFRVVGLGTSQTLTVEEEASRDFPAATTSVFKARYEIQHDTFMADDLQDGARPYYRRIVSANVWADIDVQPIDIETFVNEVEVNVSHVDVNVYPWGGIRSG